MDRENADPLSTRAKLELALARARQGRLAEAKVAFEEVLAADPDCFEALMWLSNMARGVGDPNEARTLATRALEAARRTVANDPDEGEARNRLGNALFATGEYEEAAVQFEPRASRFK